MASSHPTKAICGFSNFFFSVLTTFQLSAILYMVDHILFFFFFFFFFFFVFLCFYPLFFFFPFSLLFIFQHFSICLIPSFFFFFFFFFFLGFLGLPLWHIEVPKLGTVAAGLHHSHSDARFKLHLQPTQQFMARLDT